MRYDHTIDIAAPPERVWSVVADVARWPEWNPAFTAVTPLQPGPLREGLEARIEQPGRPPSVWTVTRLVEGRSFAWGARIAGMRVVGDHVLEPTPAGTRVTLSIEVGGLLALPLGWVVMRAARQNVPQEAAGLKRRSEQGA